MTCHGDIIYGKRGRSVIATGGSADARQRMLTTPRQPKRGLVQTERMSCDPMTDGQGFAGDPSRNALGIERCRHQANPGAVHPTHRRVAISDRRTRTGTTTQRRTRYPLPRLAHRRLTRNRGVSPLCSMLGSPSPVGWAGADPDHRRPAAGSGRVAWAVVASL